MGLLILLGIGLFGGLVLWLRGFNPTNRPYELVAEFEDVMGVQIGTPVMYRGVSVGRVSAINAQSNVVEVSLEIIEKELRMPSKVLVETVESGLIGEMSIEISPLAELSPTASEINPTSRDCDSGLILCDGDRLTGEIGPSYEALLRSASDLTELFADPELLAQLKETLTTVTATSENAGRLAQQATLLTQQAQAEIGPLSSAALQATDSATLAAQQVASTAEGFSFTASELNTLIGENRGVLVDTLSNVQAASVQLRTATDSLAPSLERGELVGNLETLVANASAASEDLQVITASLNTPANLVLLQQTLESARDALMSAQKVMADVDEITGDPAVREQIRNLINGLGALVSSTQTLEQHSEIASALNPLVLSAEAATSEAMTDEDARLNGVRSDSHIGLQPGASTGNVAGDLTDAPSGEQRPILVFDGERYILRSPRRVAAGSNGATVDIPAHSTEESTLLETDPRD